MARALFKSWFVDFDPVRAKMEGRDTGLPQHLADLFPDRMVESELEEIPEGWRIGTVQDVCTSVRNGSTPKRREPAYWDGGDIPWFKTGELTDGPLLDSEEHITSRGLAESSCEQWPVGTVLVALYASPTVGRLGVLTRPSASNQACSGLVPQEPFTSHFLFQSLYFAREELQRVAVGAAQQNISQAVVRDQKIVVPSDDCTAGFSSTMRSLFEASVVYSHEIETLADIRDILLPKLVSGQIRLRNAKQFVEVAQ